MTELRKCPFCGGEASQWEFKKLAGRGAEIECIKCQAKIQRVTLKEAIEAWNKRVPPTAKQIEEYIEKTHKENMELVTKLKKKYEVKS